MKQLSAALLALITSVCTAQIKITAVGLTDTSQSYFYIGVDNPVEIKGLTPSHMVSIQGGGSSLTKVDNNRYIVRVSSVTDDCKISVTKQGPGKILVSKNFSVRYLPEPKINWISGSTTTKDSLLQSPFLSMDPSGSYFRLDFQVMSYNIAIDTHTGSILQFAATRDQFPASFIEHLKANDVKGKILTFDEIRVKGPDGRIAKVPSIVLYLKD